MSLKPKSILVISVDDAVSQSVSAALADDSGIRVEAQSSTLAQMNGRAIKMMSDHDIVLFQTSPDDEADLGAI
ncbi:MAG: hypothetical protein OEY05_16770, partial [Paracoccaceae bacterium]|nr:hypothetical protein [Paracoccaceae bacterium]